MNVNAEPFVRHQNQKDFFNTSSNGKKEKVFPSMLLITPQKSPMWNIFTDTPNEDKQNKKEMRPYTTPDKLPSITKLINEMKLDTSAQSESGGFKSSPKVQQFSFIDFAAEKIKSMTPMQ